MTEIKFLGKLLLNQYPNASNTTKHTIYIYYRSDNNVYSFDSLSHTEINLSLINGYNNNAYFLFIDAETIVNVLINNFVAVTINNNSFNYIKNINKRQTGYLYFALPFIYSINEILGTVTGTGFIQTGTVDIQNNTYLLYRTSTKIDISNDITCNVTIKIITEFDRNNLNAHISNHQDPHQVLPYIISQGYDINRVGEGVKKIIYNNKEVLIDNNHTAWIKPVNYEYYFIDNGNSFRLMLMPDGNYWMTEDYYDDNYGMYYDNEPLYKSKFGKLYTWNEAKLLEDDIKRLPSKQDYINLIQQVIYSEDTVGIILSNAGTKFKNILNTKLDDNTSFDNNAWLYYDDTVKSYDILGLHLNPTGRGDMNDFYSLGQECRYWTTSPYTENDMPTGGKLTLRCIHSSNAAFFHPCSITEYNPIRYIINKEYVKRRIIISSSNSGSTEYADQKTIFGTGQLGDEFKLEWQ
jgi:uncharacterized protein (TIGR02145 family)